MKTVICQSFRTQNVPTWMSTCMDSVRQWSARRHYDYEFMDDSFFDLVPQWYRERSGGSIYLMSDLGRLIFARNMLARGYERAVWVDADVLVFDAEAFDITVETEYAFTREAHIYPRPTASGGRVANAATWDIQVAQRVTNSVSAFVRGNSLLDFYIHAAQAMVKQMSPGNPNVFAVGTNWLTSQANFIPIPLLDGVGLISPPVMQELAVGPGPMVRVFAALNGQPLYAANLCASLVSNADSPWAPLYEPVIEKLLSTRGNILNHPA